MSADHEAQRRRLERSRVSIGDCTLYNDDCAFILRQSFRVDALVTDQPYGLGMAKRGRIGSGTDAIPATEFEPSDWDNSPVDPDLMRLVLKRGRWQIVFGGNYYMMPPASCWLVWDKMNTGDFADCELAWTNLPKAARRIQYRWNGMLRQNNEPRGDHPTQKPVGVMKWCIGQLPDDAMVILDPFMGSGTTGVACVEMGRKFVGIELDKHYFDAACRRIAAAYSKPQLAIPSPISPARGQRKLR
jgi:DNA modification methylase